MALFSQRNKNKTSISEVTADCPKCGRSAVFTYDDKLPPAEELKCSFCGADLRREFLHEALEKQISLHKAAQKKLIWYLITVVFTLFLLTYYMSTRSPAGWIYFLLILNLVLLLAGIVLALRNKRYISEIKKKQKQFDL